MVGVKALSGSEKLLASPIEAGGLGEKIWECRVPWLLLATIDYQHVEKTPSCMPKILRITSFL